MFFVDKIKKSEWEILFLNQAASHIIFLLKTSETDVQAPKEASSFPQSSSNMKFLPFF
jgi:hypothetical protein